MAFISNLQQSGTANASLEFKISAEASAISNELSERIKTRIKNNGQPIDFQTFMQMALYEPQLGYYQNNLHKFGEKGDFITAPELSSLFADCIAESMSDTLNKNGVSSILEVGAGSGRLAVDLIKALSSQKNEPSQYYILETSASLQAQQKQLVEKECPDYLSKVIWLSELPKDFAGIIIANEVIDAIPCQIIEKTEQGWFYRDVDCENDLLRECLGKAVNSDELPCFLKQQDAEEQYLTGYKTEIRKQASGWLSALSNSLSSGHILLIDYGYPSSEFYHPQRTQGSLTCFINHHSHADYLQAIGLQDITAHVDFTDIATVSDKLGLQVGGFTTQAGFLLENGILEKSEAWLMSNENAANDIDRYKISLQLQKLMMPGQMGEVLKVMCLSKLQNKNDVVGKNAEISLKGFSMQDQLRRL
ncbi:MAG: class I SAM-dependent methyltransferase [Kangiellaceae bacterium]